MDRLIYTAASGARALMQRQDGLAHNLANASTPGFRADLVALDLRRPHLVPHNDPLGTLVHTGQGRDVSHVIVEGEVLVEEMLDELPGPGGASPEAPGLLVPMITLPNLSIAKCC